VVKVIPIFLLKELLIIQSLLLIGLIFNQNDIFTKNHDMYNKIMINWEKLYYKHIENCKNQKIEEGKICHKHHILPKSSGGNDNKDNLIKLTYSQHVFAHFILYKWKLTNNNWISYRLMSGINESKKQAIEELKIQKIKESKNNKKWPSKLIEKRRQTVINNIANLSEEDF
jgi:basic membrane lipoprotein Med (substrate-binding protein (PBP1-ABC) superfamily)